MDCMETVKNGIERLYKTNPYIHISLSKTHPKIIVAAEPARIVGVFRNIFQVEECGEGRLPIRHTFQYGDVLIGQVRIEELDYIPVVSLLEKK